MLKILIISHGLLAKGMENTMKLFIGENERFSYISAYIDDVCVKEKIDDYMRTVGVDDHLVICTDIKGGSVNTEMMQYIYRPNTYIISGFNFPLILTLATYGSETINEKEIDKIVNTSKEGLEHIKIEVSDCNIELD